MFAEVFRFELGYQLTRKWTWFYFLVFAGLLLRLTTESFFDNARELGYFFNAPYVLAEASVLGGLFGMILTAAVSGDAATRDVHTRLAPLMYTTPVSKAAYLGGRFAAAFTAAALLMLAIPLGQALALLIPGLERELIGPIRPAAYLLSYASLVLPTVFATCALMFTAAVLSRRAMTSFLVAAGLFLSALFTNDFIARTKGYWALARLLDPFAFTAMSEISRSRTPLQKSQLLVGLEPTLLANRGVWLAVGALVLAYAFARFGFRHEEPARLRWWPFGRGRRAVADPLATRAEGEAAVRAASRPLPAPHPRFDAGARARQVWAIASESFGSIARSRGALGALAIALLIAYLGPELSEHLGVPLVPVTGFLAGILGSPVDAFAFVAPLICVFYAGELVWRERDAGLGAIADAAPLPAWVPLLGKGLGLGLALACWQGLLMAAGMYIQLSMGHTALEPWLWIAILFGLGLSGHLLFAVLAIALHVLLNQKYAAHLVALAAYGIVLFGAEMGLEHHLLAYASTPGWSYSDMRGFGLSLGPVGWFKLYWAGWALLLAVGASLLWVRGPESGLRARWQRARERLPRPVLATAALAALVIVGTGAWIFYNTNVRNPYLSAAQRDARRVDYERRYARYARVAQPTVVATRLHVELYPAQAKASIEGSHVFVNQTSRPIGTLHVETSGAVDTAPVRFDRATTLVRADDDLRHYIVRLQAPLQPGEAVQMDFKLRFGGRGFGNGGIDDAIAPKASHFEQDWLPVLGYQHARELDDEAKRRRFGLPARPEIAPHDDLAARHDLRGRERIRLDATIGTVADQVAVAPGRLQREWRQGGRRYFRYVTDAPLRNAYGIYSAPYQVHEARWRDVAIRVYTHATHGANVARMVESAQASLERYTRELGPYPAKQLTIVEAPGYDVSARAHPTSIRIFEGYALMNPDADWRKVDFAFAVMAHEIAHQWWGNQLAPAPVAGAPFVSESMAWYSAMGVMEEAKGEAHLARFLSILRESELSPRSRTGVPLLESADSFSAYRLGPFSMVALREAIGDERLRLALRRFMDKHRHARAPLPTSLDLYAELLAVTPPAQHAFVADLFARQTFWNLRTKSASARRLGDAWEVTLEVEAGKVSVARDGKETPQPLREAIEIGVYGPAPEAVDAPNPPLYLRRHALRPGLQRIVVTVPDRPASAGVDPRNLLIDTERTNNTASVSGALAD